MKRSRPVSLVEWYDETEGHHTHCHAEKPEMLPGIVCASEEERDQLLKAEAECEKLRDTAAGWEDIAERREAKCENLRGEASRERDARDYAERRLAHARAALKECREAWSAMKQCLKEDEIRVSAVGHMSGWTLMDAALAADTPRGADLRTQALEEAAEVCEGYWDGTDGAPMMQAAMDIRSLAATPRGATGEDSICERYQKMGKCTWFREAYEGKSLGDATPQEGTGKPTARDLIGQGRDAQGNIIDARAVAGEVFEAGVEDRTRGTGEPPEHLKPYLATEPPTLSAAEQEHADRLAVEIGRDQKGETK